MHTEFTDNNATTPAGWIFFDAECRFCVTGRRRWGRIFERRGFVWLPMQTPATAERFGGTPGLLMAEMWVLPAGARALSGVDAWIGLMRYVWWLKPLAVVLNLPGSKRVSQAVYRWIARNRYCIAGRCRVSPRPPRKPHHRHAAFLEFP
jgi:predicted DCC family thiol-disulfide oxidoreductase YuxK